MPLEKVFPMEDSEIAVVLARYTDAGQLDAIFIERRRDKARITVSFTEPGEAAAALIDAKIIARQLNDGDIHWLDAQRLVS